MQQSELLQKRDDFRKEIRKQHHEQSFKFARLQILDSQKSALTSQDRILCQQEAFRDIMNDSCEHLAVPFRTLIRLDPTLRLFNLLTAWLIHPDDPYHELFGMHKAFEPMHEQPQAGTLALSRLSESQQVGLQEMWQYFVGWSQAHAQHIGNLVSTLRLCTDEQALLRDKVVSWVGLLLRFILLGQTIQTVMSSMDKQLVKPYELLQRVLVGESQHEFEQRLLVKLSNLLMNFLASRDDLLVRHMRVMTAVVGSQLKLAELYYNMFLVKGVDPQTRETMIANYLDILDHNRQHFLQHHSHHTKLLHFAVANSSQEQNHSNDIRVRMLAVLDSLMRVVNFQYDGCQPEAKDSPIHTVCLILRSLTEAEPLRMEMARLKHLRRMVLNQLPSNPYVLAMTAVPALETIANLSHNEQAAQELLISEPTLWQKLASLLIQVSKQHNQSKLQLSEEFTASLLFCWSNLISTALHSERFLRQDLPIKVLQVFLQVDRSTRKPAALRVILECCYITVNIFLVLNRQASFNQMIVMEFLVTLLRLEGLQELFVYLLTHPENRILFTNCLNVLNFLVLFDTEHYDFGQGHSAFFNFLEPLASLDLFKLVSENPRQTQQVELFVQQLKNYLRTICNDPNDLEDT